MSPDNYNSLDSAGLMTWEIVHNIDSLLIKDDLIIGSGFDLTVHVNEEESNPDLAECVKGTFYTVLYKVL